MDGVVWGWARREELGRWAIDDDGVGIVVAHHVNERDSPQVDGRITPPAQYGAFCGGDYGVVGVVYVDSVLVKYGDVIGVGELARAKQGVLADAWGDVEFVGGRANSEGVLRNFRGWYHCSAGQDELLGGFSSGALAWVIGSAHS